MNDRTHDAFLINDDFIQKPKDVTACHDRQMHEHSSSQRAIAPATPGPSSTRVAHTRHSAKPNASEEPCILACTDNCI